MRDSFRIEREAFDAWLALSCATQGVPVAVSDPVTVRHLGMLLGSRRTAGRPRTRGGPQSPAPSDSPAGNDSGQEVA